MTGYPEPPRDGSEVDTLLGSLERQRATFAYKCADLTTEQLRVTVGASSVTLGGLLKHLAYMEDLNFAHNLGGESLPAPWAQMDPERRSEEAWRTTSDAATELYAVWSAAVSRSREVVARVLKDGDPSVTFVEQPGVECSVRRLVVDFIEEYGRHTGHADLIRESIDGRVGEDPPGAPYPFRLQ